ncbi:MAG TPA: MFS transporter [Acidimicrobiia bacterium]
MKAQLGRNYWKLWIASVTSNFGDGVSTVAYPWLAAAITRDGFELGLVTVALRLPWLVVSLPAGVVTDRSDRRRLMVGMDLIRFGLMLSVAAIVAANSDVLTGPGPEGTLKTFLLWVVIGASFLMGCAEVLRDNAAQTILPAIVPADQLEKANGRLWGAEMVMNSFVGPPVGGLLLAVALALPVFVDASTFAVAAVLVLLIGGEFRSPVAEGPRPSFRAQLKEGVTWLWSHSLFRPMALILGVINGLSMMTFAIYVLFVQEILELDAAAFGALLTSGAVGGVVGSMVAHRVSARIGKGPSLFVTLLGGAVAFLTIGLTSSAIVVWVMFLAESFLAVLWNVITVSLRQRAIPDTLLGRVNSVYRFFGWGMMSLGALLGGAIVSAAEPLLGREWALRLPFVIAGAFHVIAFLYALPRLNSARIAAVEEEAGGA